MGTTTGTVLEPSEPEGWAPRTVALEFTGYG